MKTLSIDIETYSSENLAKCGVYRYAESPDFEVLLFGYSVDGGPVEVVDLTAGEMLPADIRSALTDPTVTKWAFNAQFERVCLSRFLGYPTGQYLDPSSWHCTMVWAATLGLPLSLEGVGAVLGLEKQKPKEGKDLIRYFCTPAKARDGSRVRHYPSDAPEKWALFKAYNLRDVETEIAIQQKLSKFPVTESEWVNYTLDQQINDRGIMLDRTLVTNAIRCDEQFKRAHMEQARSVTGLDNPNSPVQLKAWLAEKGVEADSLSKAAVAEMLEKADGEVELALSLRQELAKSSVKKYTAMQTVVGSDDRARGLIQFYGANRTGRYAGRLIQVQNLPQNHLPDLDTARALVRSGNTDAVEMLYDSVPLVLSELIRTAFVPKPGCRFYVADFSAIEARVIAWIAGEHWRQEVFANGGDIYCASASQMFHVPVEKHGVNGHLRQKGKIAELALGYGGSVGALKAMGALNYGLQEEELKPLVDAWRLSNPHITKFWWDVDKAASTCVRERSATETHGIRFFYQSGMMFVVLPSGRRLVYVEPKMGLNHFGNESVTYEGVGEQKKWLRLESYGPKFVENIVQATARDILAEAMLRLNAAGYRAVRRSISEQADPLTKPGVVGAFCRAYTDVYAPSAMNGRYDYIPADSSAGVVTYDGKFAFSHHATDPVCGRLLNAFDLVRLHRFRDLDDHCVPDTAPGKLPSFQAMSDFALKDDKVKAVFAEERKAQASEEFSDEDWQNALELDKAGKVKNTLQNLTTILMNDPLLKPLVFNQLLDGMEIKGEVPWKHPSKFWRDADDAQLISYVDSHYGTFSARNYDIAVAKVTDDRSYHPIREFIENLPEWDGIKRTDTLLIDYLGADDNEYVRAVTRKTLCAAIKRVLYPGCKFDSMLVLNGPQGVGKSTLIAKLAGEWFSDSLNLGDTKDKTAAEKLQGYWILEIGELAGLKKAEVETLRSFLSRQNDIYRAAFGKRATPHLRQCVFFGTTNAESGYLRDTTGNRRFWPVKTPGTGSKHSWDLTPEVICQIWAEALVYVKQGEKLYLSAELEALSKAEQREAMESDEREGLVRLYLDTLLPTDWDGMDVFERRGFLSGSDFGEIKKSGTVKRTQVSNMEIWCECFGKERANIRRTDSNELTAILARLGWKRLDSKVRIPLYGPQYIFVPKECSQ